MSRMLSRVMSILGLAPKPIPHAVEKALIEARAQQALFQLEIQLDKCKTHHQYLVLSDFSSKGLVLVSPEPFFKDAASWTNRVFLFRFLIQPDPNKPPLLHKFRSRITTAANDRRTITVTIPKGIITLEQRRNVRIRLHVRHMPQLTIWGVQNGHDATKGVSLRPHPILELPASHSELSRTLKNISAGGVRLSLAPKVISQNKEWFREGRKLIVQIVFPGNEFKFAKHLFISKICNIKTEDALRPEFGLQFLASRVCDPNPRWHTLGTSGCEQLARVIHAIQLEYYSEAKQRMMLRERSISACPGDDLNI